LSIPSAEPPRERAVRPRVTLPHAKYSYVGTRSKKPTLGHRALGGSKLAIPAGTTVERAIDDFFLRHGFGGFPVAEDGHIVGLVSLVEIKSCPKGERATRDVRSVMRAADEALRHEDRVARH
jgi:hypothetical protein